ncbi:MAG: tetratricopeptide repeat protein [Nitrospirae bacterium]|nr:tetratricopeptide repeat protein [Nitrospirota bacterium]
MEEIEKLRIRVEKDPNSRLFLPLAEEYRKSGMLDEAITVILRGLEHQPGYTSARVALGRIYLEKNMMDEAKNEFEAVVSAIPDNLFAHRKLADIYKERGETEKAMSEYKTVIQLNPLDEDAMMCLSEIEGRAFEEEPAVSAVAEPPLAPETGTAGAFPGGEPEGGAHLRAEAEPGEAFGSDFDKFSGSFPGIEEEELEKAGEVVEIPEDQSFEMPDESSFGDILTEAPGMAEEVSDLSEATVPNEEAGAPLETMNASTADAFIAGGNFYKALETYRQILTNDPENKQILQRVAELKALMTLMGKGNEVLIAKLESFLDAVKRGFPTRP